MRNQDIPIDKLIIDWERLLKRARPMVRNSKLFDDATKKELLGLIAKRSREISTAIHQYRRGRVSEDKVRQVINSGLTALEPWA